MITKILISLLKKNKVQLETEHTAWKFNVVLVLESLLGSFCASVGLNMVLDYFVFHRVDNFNIFGLVTLLYGIANMKILFDLFIRSKGTDPWDWKSELTEKYYTANEILNLKAVEEDLKGYKSLWLNIDNKKKFISLSTFYNVHKEVRVYSNKNVAYGTMLEKLEYIHD